MHFHGAALQQCAQAHSCRQSLFGTRTHTGSKGNQPGSFCAAHALLPTFAPSLSCCVTAGGSCLGRSTPGVTWTAHWASNKVHTAVDKHMLNRALTLLQAADVYSIDESALPTLESLGLHAPLAEATYAVSIRRHTGIRALQLLVALTQLGFIVYCLMKGAGQVLWVVVMSRLLCVRSHFGRRDTSQD